MLHTLFSHASFALAPRALSLILPLSGEYSALTLDFFLDSLWLSLPWCRSLSALGLPDPATCHTISITHLSSLPDRKQLGTQKALNIWRGINKTDSVLQHLPCGMHITSTPNHQCFLGLLFLYYAVWFRIRFPLYWNQSLAEIIWSQVAASSREDFH